MGLWVGQLMGRSVGWLVGWLVGSVVNTYEVSEFHICISCLSTLGWHKHVNV